MAREKREREERNGYWERKWKEKRITDIINWENCRCDFRLARFFEKDDDDLEEFLDQTDVDIAKEKEIAKTKTIAERLEKLSLRDQHENNNEDTEDDKLERALRRGDFSETRSGRTFKAHTRAYSANNSLFPLPSSLYIIPSSSPLLASNFCVCNRVLHSVGSLLNFFTFQSMSSFIDAWTTMRKEY